MADIDRDGKRDLVLSEFWEDRISILIGRGGGAFDFPRQVPTGRRPIALAVADFNRDGIPDVATANYLSFDVSVHLGRGDGTFEARRDFFLGYATYPRSLVVGDFNADGTPDLALTIGPIAVLLGTGDGGFRELARIAAEDRPGPLSVADLDSDGHEDIVTANLNEGKMSVYLGDGTGLFSVRSSPVGKFPDEVVLGDLDGDGDLDAAVNGIEVSGISILLGDRTGAFAPKTILPLEGYPKGLLLADFDVDGELDLVAGNAYRTQGLHFFRGLGDGNFEPAKRIGEGYLYGILETDLDGDGRRDMILGSTRGIQLAFNEGSGGFRFPRVLEVKYRPNVIVARDIDGDGRNDLAVGTEWSSHVDIFLGEAGPTRFRRMTPLQVSGPARDITIADFDSDGRNDLAVTTSRPSCAAPGSIPVPCPEPQLQVFFGTGAGEFGMPRTVPAGRSPWGVAAADFDRDGTTDLAVGDSESDQLLIFAASRARDFMRLQGLATGRSPHGLALGDVNGDAVPDAVVTNLGSNDLSLFLSTGGGLVAGPRLAVGEEPVGVDIGDLNGDGHADLVIANRASRDVSILFGREGAEFTPSSSASIRGTPTDVALGDLTSDGRVDLAVSSFTAGSTGEAQNGLVSVIELSGSNVSRNTELPIGRQPASMVASDFSGDGIPDLAAANSASDDLSLLINRCSFSRIPPPRRRSPVKVILPRASSPAYPR